MVRKRSRPSALDKSVAARRESKTVDFKRSFDPASAAEWCELVKDLVAMANSGGGFILVGVEDDGTPGPAGCADALLALDGAAITDKVARYTGVQFDGFAISDGHRAGAKIAVVAIARVLHPLIFEKPGSYSVGDGKQKTAFGVGTLYVRHGAKSEPATSEDVARMVERALQQIRRDWMSGVRKVVNAAAGSTVSVLPPLVTQSADPKATPIRFSKDPTAPAYQIINPDSTHPWRQKELLAEVNAKLPTDRRINQFDVLAIRYLYHVDEEPRYYYKARFATSQYSPAFRDWLIDRYNEDHGFFAKAREEFKRRQQT